ncbi:pH signaling pathway protein [Moelleriella libera RCEF 2490]|uniref:pH signaling pathway protein n=1 Tax=Moelleriella libera RCEF 2490 TaxID=1081109 RepID=A0A166U4R4_9HYPO|nr:pH signaling pathway protein [Moelleriella libera RCEF 2490]
MATTTSPVSSGATGVVSSSFATLVSTSIVETSASAVLSLTNTMPAAALMTQSSLGDSSLSAHDQANQPLVSNYRDPFSASTFPMAYALAATTVTAYMLLIMLFITPRSFLDGGVVYLGRRSGFTHSSSGGENIGGRPWLQKVAALTVAISLTIANYDTFKVAEYQYSYGVQNAALMQVEVLGSVELRVTRLVSNFFLWLAQAQTLIRLFPRHREKVIIKWVAFSLITLDFIFSAINNFKPGEPGTSGPNPAAGSFDHPVPALSYMFQLLLGVLYAAWVIYYSLMKKRYAFYHPLMKNMCVLAIISLTAILIPIAFFILDVSRPKFTGWGDYVRWVGAAAASVIVWEWVERIEALEREEKKGGILGREVFDGDDVLEVSALDYPWDRKRKFRKDEGPDGSAGLGRSWGNRGRNARSAATGDLGSQQSQTQSNGWPVVSSLTNRQRGQARSTAQETAEQPTHRTMGNIFRPPWPARPPAAVTPISRTDTASAASTVYAVRYQASSETTGQTPDPFSRTPEPYPPPPVPQPPPPHHVQSHPHLLGHANMNAAAADTSQSASSPASSPISIPTSFPTNSSKTYHLHEEGTGPLVPQGGQSDANHGPRRPRISTHSPSDVEAQSSSTSDRSRRWKSLAQQPSRRSPDRTTVAEVTTIRGTIQDDSIGSRWDIKSRLEMFAANQADRIREKLRPPTDTDNLPVTFIPAPPRQGTALREVMEEEETGRRSQSSEMESGHASDEAAQGRYLGAWVEATAQREGETTNPPLWPGVRRHTVTYDEDDEDSYTEESGDESSVAGASGGGGGGGGGGGASVEDARLSRRATGEPGQTRR